MDGRSLAAKRGADLVIERALIADLEVLWSQVKGWDPIAVENALVELLPGMVDRYGSAYAEVAAQWFEALIGERPVLGGSLRVEQVQRSVRWALRPYLQGAPLSGASARVAGSVLRHAKQAGRDTLDASVRETPGVLYARRLQGPSHCDFCVILASRGPVYGSRLTAGDRWQGNEFHDLCDCEIVPVRGDWVPDISSPMSARWVGQNPRYDFEKLYVEEYKPYWRKNASLDDVIEKRIRARRSTPDD